MTEPTTISLGCRLNAFEADVARTHAGAAGLGDCVIVNTCAVTSEAVRQAAQTVRRLRRERPDARIVVTGCAAQLDPDRFAGMPEVDAVIGNAEKLDPATFVALRDEPAKRVRVGNIMSRGADPRQFATGAANIAAGGRTRAFLAIQTGCDHRCTFCTIPFARGPSRSLPAGEVIARARDLTEAGYREIVLTGVDLTAYGLDLPGPMSLGRLVQKILVHVRSLPRLRLSSIDQMEIDEPLLEALASEQRLMPHLHLSMQSGDDLILKRMKRRHTRSDAISFCHRVRHLRPDIAFGADLIAGFPTETDLMFETTRATIHECGLTFVHVFPYSARPGTPAARMPQVSGSVIRDRAAQLRAEADLVRSRFLDAHIGRDVEILMEKGGIGRTPQNAEVMGPGETAPGTLTHVRITEHNGWRLSAKAISANRPGRLSTPSIETREVTA